MVSTNEYVLEALGWELWVFLDPKYVSQTHVQQ